MFGKNLKRGLLVNNGKQLEVKSIFKTLQGEGPFALMPAIFIRLGGCNLACDFCDTEFEDFEIMKLDDLVVKVKRLSLNSQEKRVVKLIVITGGEPFRQNIEPLCKILLQEKFQIQIETNGTLYRKLPQEITIICSPKVGKLGYINIREDLLKSISAMKFIISKNTKEYSFVPELGQNKYNIPVYIQPMDQYNKKLNKDNQLLALELALEYGYRLSLQTHKILGIE